jgi:hypothetical protein
MDQQAGRGGLVMIAVVIVFISVVLLVIILAVVGASQSPSRWPLPSS